MRTGALLIASFDFEKEVRDNENIPVFLPMYPLDGTTVIKREIAALRKAELSPILVLLGYQKEVLKNHLSHNNVIFLEDEAYQEHDREEALRIGLAEAGKYMDRVVVVPVECPSFSGQTLQTLLECGTSAVPVYEGTEGNPGVYVFRENGVDAPEPLPVEDPGTVMSLLDEDGMNRAERYAKGQRTANELHCKTKVVLTREEDFFGPGIYRLLKYIDETGSIQAAAAKMNMSYSKGWKMVNKVEKEMGFLFLNRCNGGKNGGSSTITEEGRLFMERYHAMTEDLRRISQRFFDTYFRDFQ